MDDIDRDYLFNWLREAGEAFLKESGRDFVPREGVGAFLILEYPTMAGARAAALHIDGIKRMTREDARAIAAEAVEQAGGGSNLAHDP